MDGRGRFLRSLKTLITDFGPAFMVSRPAFAGMPAGLAGKAVRKDAAAKPHPRARRRLRRRWDARALAFCAGHPRLIGRLLFVALFLSTGLYGAVCGGEYAAFIDENGSIPDQIGRKLGFGIEAVTISGQSDLSETDVLRIGGISPKQSLLFLNANLVHDRLKATAVVKDVSVTKLYPNRLIIGILERRPVALWQKDGDVSVLSSDGMVIAQRHDERYDTLPFVAGEGADAHVADYVKLLAAAGDLRARIRAGTLVAGRRWDIVMNSGLLVKLPEMNPAAAMTDLVRLDATARILDKDIISLDLRVPGRVVARLTDESAANRADLLSKKAGKKGGPA